MSCWLEPDHGKLHSSVRFQTTRLRASPNATFPNASPGHLEGIAIWNSEATTIKVYTYDLQEQCRKWQMPQRRHERLSFSDWTTSTAGSLSFIHVHRCKANGLQDQGHRAFFSIVKGCTKGWHRLTRPPLDKISRFVWYKCYCTVVYAISMAKLISALSFHYCSQFHCSDLDLLGIALKIGILQLHEPKFTIVTIL